MSKTKSGDFCRSGYVFGRGLSWVFTHKIIVLRTNTATLINWDGTLTHRARGNKMVILAYTRPNPRCNLKQFLDCRILNEIDFPTIKRKQIITVNVE